MDKRIIEDIPVPRRLYKYRSFDLYSLRMLTSSSVYFSDPTLFNDPLDCKPELDVDIDIDSLEMLCMRMTDASSQILNECKNEAAFYNSENPGEMEDYYLQIVASRVKKMLYSQMGKIGVLSLAENWSCPLMWSHYGDQHKGICLGFDTPRLSDVTLKKVNYEGQRCIKCSDLMSCFIEGNSVALEGIEETFFFTKANEWKYEREWRVKNHKSGEESSPYELKEVYFGMRCDDAVKTAVLNLKRTPELAYYQVFSPKNTFELDARLVNAEDRQWFMPRPSARVAFANIWTSC